jgi:tol-pal system protein YbgF
VRKLWLLVLIVPFIACTSTEDMNLLHREITDVQRQVQSLETATLGRQDLRAMERKMEELTSQTMRSNADLAMRVSQLQEQIEALHASLDLTTRRLQSISQELAAARARVGRPQLPPVTTAEAAEQEAGAGEGGGDTPAEEEAAETAVVVPAATTPEELYRSSYEDYLRGNYDLASQGFSEYIKRWPDTDLSDNAMYWIGECYDAQDLSQEALEVFSKILDDYPTSDKAAAAQLKKGLLYLKLGDQGQGVVHLQYVVYEHPGTKEADLARDRLRSLGLTIR